jgi:hypothetical protein
MSSVQSLVPEPVEPCPPQNSSCMRPMLQRSPSLPTIPESSNHHHQHTVDRKRFSFASPPNEELSKDRLPSMPMSVPKANQLKHCQDSPLAPLAHLASKRATTPSSVPQTVVYSSVGATPGFNRAPLQCITPLNQRELIFSNVMQPVREIFYLDDTH